MGCINCTYHRIEAPSYNKVRTVHALLSNGIVKLIEFIEIIGEKGSKSVNNLVRIANSPNTVSRPSHKRVLTARIVKYNHSLEIAKCQYCEYLHKVKRCPT